MTAEEYRFTDQPPAIWLEISRAYDRALCYSSPWVEELEVFLNPVDAVPFPRHVKIMGMPLKTSLGVPEGRVYLFDRRRMCYLPDGLLAS